MTRPTKIGADEALKRLPLWRKVGGERDAIQRTYRFSDFTAAFGFMTRTASPSLTSSWQASWTWRRGRRA